MLDPREARKDLTDRECAKLIGGAIGCLLDMADRATVLRAIAWWAENAELCIFEIERRKSRDV